MAVVPACGPPPPADCRPPWHGCLPCRQQYEQSTDCSIVYRVKKGFPQGLALTQTRGDGEAVPDFQWKDQSAPTRGMNLITQGSPTQPWKRPKAGRQTAVTIAHFPLDALITGNIIINR